MGFEETDNVGYKILLMVVQLSEARLYTFAMLFISITKRYFTWLLTSRSKASWIWSIFMISTSETILLFPQKLSISWVCWIPPISDPDSFFYQIWVNPWLFFDLFNDCFRFGNHHATQICGIWSKINEFQNVCISLENYTWLVFTIFINFLGENIIG